MPRRRPDSYLRTQRKRWGLSQLELAGLLGFSKDLISKCERDERLPNLGIVLKCELLFGTPPHELFPTLYKTLQDDLAAAAEALDADLSGREDAASLKKRELVEAITSRTHFIPEV